MGKFWNSLWNAAAIPIRWAGTALNTGWDVMKTWWNVVTDMGNVVADTTSKTWEILSSSWTNWKWYNKLYQVPAGLVISWATLVEGAVRSVVEPAKNLFLNVRDTFWNFFKNIGNTLKATFDSTKPVSDFSYDKLKTKEPSRNNRFSKLARWKKAA